jgi:hypothetical protein
MDEIKNAISVEFPLRGEWCAPNTPGTKIPSHGTEQFGQKYAFDFIQLNWVKKGLRFYNTSKIRYSIFGVPLKKCICWGQNVYAPCDGKIIECKDGFKERKIVHLLSDMLVVYRNAYFFNKKIGLQSILGNYIIMECSENVFAFFAHLSKNSIKVKIGDAIKKGQIIGNVGHTGNSTAPHLHFHLMDNSNIIKANGVPCVFEKYEVFENNVWKEKINEVPKDTERIRFNKN